MLPPIEAWGLMYLVLALLVDRLVGGLNLWLITRQQHYRYAKARL